MKHSKPSIPTKGVDRPLRFLDFVRFAAILTLGLAPIVILLTALLAAQRHDPAMWVLGAFLVLVPVWFGTLSVACLVMIPVWIWRLCHRPLRKSAAGTTSQKPLWDQWIDGP